MRFGSLESRLLAKSIAGGAIVLGLWLTQWLISGAPLDSLLWLLWPLAALLFGVYFWRQRRNLFAPLRSLASILEALRREDFALRARGDRRGVLGELAREINLLADTLRDHARHEQESTALLHKVLEEIDLPIFAFDDGQRLKMANPAAEKLLGTPLTSGLKAAALGLDALLLHSPPAVATLRFPGGGGRYSIGRRPFRIAGRPHELLVLAEVSGVLREERREAWQRLVRVLGHEINNSLAPIQSIAETLGAALDAGEPQLGKEELRDGLALIAGRARSLGRFVGGYAALARLPEPCLQPVALAELAARAASLETRVAVELSSPPLTIDADPDQLEQALINLIKNAADAVDAAGGRVQLSWRPNGSGVLIEVLDNGPGPPDSENLFVPFFTTKPGGSGIGLLLARRIAELHDGWLTLEAREDGTSGARAQLWLPRTRPG